MLKALIKTRLVEVFLTSLIGVFILYTAAFGALAPLLNRSIFLAIILLLGLVSFPTIKQGRFRDLGIVVDLVLALFVILACGRIALRHDEIMMDLPEASDLDIVFGWGLVVIVLELCRRSVGFLFTSIILAGVLYALFGEYAPGAFQHRGFDIQFLTETLYLGELGLWGGLVGIAATVLAAFILFGSLLLYSGASQTFIDIATRIGGASPGGAAKVATIASGMFGMLAGSSVANVATTGNVTIPMMKRLNYPAPLAAAVEAVASTGGQLAPPILGAAAFVMAEFLSVSYWTIAVAAVIPAALYYLGVYCTVHAIAVQQGLGTVAPDQMPAWKQAFNLRRLCPLLLGLGGIFVGVLKGYSIGFAVFIGISGVVLGYIAVQLRSVETAKSISANLGRGFHDAGKGLVMVGILLAGAQVLVSLINMTGLAGTISAFVAQLIGDNLFVLGLVTALVGLVLGMGLPTIAAYVLIAAMMVGPLEAAGVPGLSAQMFVLYYAALSAITPPVCVAVFIGAGIARTNWGPVAIQALRLGAITYILPLLFLYYPGLLLQGSWPEIGFALLIGIIATISVCGLLTGERFFGNPIVDAAIHGLTLAAAVSGVLPLVLMAAAVLVLRYTLYRRRRRAAAFALSSTGAEGGGEG